MIYIVWYMNKEERYTPDFEVFDKADNAVKKVEELLGKYDRIGIAQRELKGSENIG